MYGGDVHHIFIVDEAVARVGDHRSLIDHITGQQRDDCGGANFSVLVGHMAGFRHGGRNLQCVPEDMNVGHCG